MALKPNQPFTQAAAQPPSQQDAVILRLPTPEQTAERLALQRRADEMGFTSETQRRQYIRQSEMLAEALRLAAAPIPTPSVPRFDGAWQSMQMQQQSGHQFNKPQKTR